MSAFPNITNPSSIGEGVVKAQVRNKFEAGYVQSRAKHTRKRKKFSLTWGAMLNNELFGTGGVIDHFDANQGGSFSWTHPDPNAGGTFTVRYSDDEIKYKRVGNNPTWKVTINLEEV